MAWSLELVEQPGSVQKVLVAQLRSFLQGSGERWARWRSGLPGTRLRSRDSCRVHPGRLGASGNFPVVPAPQRSCMVPPFWQLALLLLAFFLVTGHCTPSRGLALDQLQQVSGHQFRWRRQAWDAAGPGPSPRRSARWRRTLPGCWRIRCGRGSPRPGAGPGRCGQGANRQWTP